MKRIYLVILIMVIVFFLSVWRLEKDFMEIEQQTRLLISIGASIVSGILTFILFKVDKK